MTAWYIDPLFQKYGHGVAHFFVDCLAYVCPYRQLMRAIAHGHKRASKWMTVDSAPDFYQATSSKKLDRARPDHIGPTTFAGSFCNLAVNFLFSTIFEPFASRSNY
jgi:hypothetical protein